MLLSDTFSVGGGGSPRTPLMRTRSGPSARQLDGVHPQRHVGIRVARAGDLVQQLRRDGVDADQRRRCPACLVITDAAVGVDLGQREAGHSVRSGDLGEEREVAAGRLRAAFDDVARGHRTGQLVVIVASPAEVGGGRADDDRCVGDPAGDDDVGAAR